MYCRHCSRWLPQKKFHYNLHRTNYILKYRCLECLHPAYYSPRDIWCSPRCQEFRRWSNSPEDISYTLKRRSPLLPGHS